MAQMHALGRAPHSAPLHPLSPREPASPRSPCQCMAIYGKAGRYFGGNGLRHGAGCRKALARVLSCDAAHDTDRLNASFTAAVNNPISLSVLQQSFCSSRRPLRHPRNVQPPPYRSTAHFEGWMPAHEIQPAGTDNAMHAAPCVLGQMTSLEVPPSHSDCLSNSRRQRQGDCSSDDSGGIPKAGLSTATVVRACRACRASVIWLTGWCAGGEGAVELPPCTPTWPRLWSGVRSP